MKEHPGRRFVRWGLWAACVLALAMGFFQARDDMAKEPRQEDYGTLVVLATLACGTLASALDFFLSPLGIGIIIGLIWGFRKTRRPLT